MKYCAVLALLLCGCLREKDPPVQIPVQTRLALQDSGEQRFTVKLVGEFENPKAYVRVHRIYVIRDETTGKEFIGVTGLGLSELGSHQIDDTTYPDER